MTWDELQAVKRMFTDRDSANDLLDLFRGVRNPNYKNTRVALLEGDKSRQVNVVMEIPPELLQRLLTTIQTYEEEIQSTLDSIAVKNIPDSYLED